MPWFYRGVHAGGMITPCCETHDADYGDYIIDYIYGNSGEEVFHNEEIIRLKRGLLTGELRPMCQRCSLAPMDFITIEEFENHLREEIIQKGYECSNETDLATFNVVNRAGFSMTNRCTLRGIYCNQSVLADKNPYFKMDFPKGKMMDCLEMLVEQGVKILETGIFGEVTLHKDWEPTFSLFHKKHPNIVKSNYWQNM